MNNSWVLICVALSIGIAFYVSKRLADLSELATCPYCYGEDYCGEFETNVSLRYRSVADVIFNLLSVKNVYFATNNGNDVVIKKLANSDEFEKLNRNIRAIIGIEDVLEALLNNRNVRVCSVDVAELFLRRFARKNLTNIWTLIGVNAEPLLLETFRREDDWPVPKLLGYCGRTVTVQNCGTPLNDMQASDWFSRAYVALQLLDAAQRFTFAHPLFRLYLTDISPDNVAVDPRTLAVSFVDLEHGILQKKTSGELYHYSEHVNEEYGFSTEEICASSVSDHNVYAVCRVS